jgi:hypothetical protein
MGYLVEIFDETQMKYIDKTLDSVITDKDLDNIELALIRFADELAKAS